MNNLDFDYDVTSLSTYNIYRCLKHIDKFYARLKRKLNNNNDCSYLKNIAELSCLAFYCLRRNNSNKKPFHSPSCVCRKLSVEQLVSIHNQYCSLVSPTVRSNY